MKKNYKKFDEAWKNQAFEGYHSWKYYEKLSSYSNHLHLKGHLSVIKEPILCEKTDMVITLDECKVCTYIELVLILACHLK